MPDDVHRMRRPAASALAYNATLVVTVLVAIAAALVAVDAVSSLLG